MAMPGGRNGSQKWGGHQPNGMSRHEDHWGDGGAYGFRGGLGDPLELRANREVEGAESPAVEGAESRAVDGATDASATGANPERDREQVEPEPEEVEPEPPPCADLSTSRVRAAVVRVTFEDEGPLGLGWNGEADGWFCRHSRG